MTKHTFCIKTDPDIRMQYVCKKEDEPTKNHHENDNELISGFMPEAPGHNLCPVYSFMKLIDKLNSCCDRLWQKPRQIVKDDSKWFCNVLLGKNTLSGFMKHLSIKCSLSLSYTNHSIRVTGATIFSKCQFGSSQIMAPATGHKSVSSLAEYQRVSDEEKLVIGQALSKAMGVSSKALW